MEIDCRKCVNCDVAKGNCRMYGSDPDKAVKACAAHGFENYILVGDKRVKKSLIHGTQAWRNILIDYDKMIQAPDITIEDLNRVFRYVCALESRLKRVEKERDVALEDLANYAHAGTICKHYYDCHFEDGCPLYPSDCGAYE